MVKIAFHTPIIDVRGTCVAIYDYARYNEEILENESIIIIPIDCERDVLAYMKFVRRFPVYMYTDEDDMEEKIKDCDIFYAIKYGTNDGVVSKRAKNAIHCVFDLTQPHGDVYAAVSETLAKRNSWDISVPHMVGLRASLTGANMREDLGIPQDAIVFGRHGGRDTFDLEIAKSAIRRTVRHFPNIHFVFLNTPAFDSHPQIHNLDSIVDMDEKNRFICTCDAMIHAQSLGETFGCSIGEFSVNNRPIVTYSGPVWKDHDHYRTVLKDKALYYLTEDECYNILTTFDPKDYRDKDNNCYREYSPKKVMAIFKKVFIDGCLELNSE